MGSKFLDLFVLDPIELRAVVQGNRPGALLEVMEDPKAEALTPALELIDRGLLCFLPKGEEHPDGLMFCRTVERLMGHMDHRRWCIEFYPDEGEYALWSLAFDACEAPWLALPRTPHGVGDISWRSPNTCRSLASSLSGSLSAGSFNADYVSESALAEAIEALRAGASSKRGVFAIYQA